jgi:hypothetical protein
MVAIALVVVVTSSSLIPVLSSPEDAKFGAKQVEPIHGQNLLDLALALLRDLVLARAHNLLESIRLILHDMDVALRKGRCGLFDIDIHSLLPLGLLGAQRLDQLVFGGTRFQKSKGRAAKMKSVGFFFFSIHDIWLIGV